MTGSPNNSFYELSFDEMSTIQTIKGTNRTPEIILDPEKGDFYIKGCSMPENVDEFYTPILNYLDQYLQKPSSKTRVIFELEYLNSSSSQMLLAILYKLKRLLEMGHDLKVEWHYMQDDDDICETGKTFSELSGLSFEYYEQT